MLEEFKIKNRKQSKPTEERENPLVTRYSQFFAADPGERWFRALLFLNLFVLFIRPQNDIKILVPLYLSLIFSVLGCLFWLPWHRRTWNPITKSMVMFLGLGVIWVPLARNNHEAFYAMLDLSQQFLGIVFPIVAFGASGQTLKRLMSYLPFLGAYIGIYALTHNGRGPGGFLGDENDCCLVLIMFFSFALTQFTAPRSFLSKLFLLACSITIATGIIATISRGGFVGFVAALFYFFLKSKNKLLVSLFGLITFAAVVPFVPQEYWNEMKTISDTSRGTAQARRDIWAVGIQIWLDPAHFIAGTGMQNSPRWLQDYEPIQNLSPHGKSISGRAIHSLYIQLVGDLGLIGLILFVSIVYLSLSGNVRVIRDTLLHENDPDLPYEIILHLKFLRATAIGLNMAWVGVLWAGLFISVLYYPPIWLLACLSGTLVVYWDKLTGGRVEERKVIPISRGVESST